LHLESRRVKLELDYFGERPEVQEGQFEKHVSMDLRKKGKKRGGTRKGRNQQGGEVDEKKGERGIDNDSQKKETGEGGKIKEGCGAAGDKGGGSVLFNETQDERTKPEGKSNKK